MLRGHPKSNPLYSSAASDVYKGQELEHARRRDAQILAEIVGYGMSGDAYHITAPPEDGSGATRVMRATLEDAGVDPTEVDYINAHGTSTPPNDRIETRAIKAVFSDHAYKLAISSTKSMTGHLLGAAGGLEAGVSVLVLRDQIIPPTINLENPDPDCDLDYVPGTARKAEIRYVLSSSFGFGGTNACILLKRYPNEYLDCGIISTVHEDDTTLKLPRCERPPNLITSSAGVCAAL